ncbi:MAG: transposase [Microcystis sp.]|uniref:transposase n=1 Tax=Microcystis sp. TaxID=1127 RepID=UPI0022BB02C6|nr:transposase [Microcystis sp. LE17-20D]MCZ8065996.1 transposase [Microcystis sp. LE17-20D]MCZ8274246.1 transposase [Microcystis sp. LE19-4.1E]
MTFDPEKHHRRSIRLRNYDYSQPGAYFVTICTYQKQSWFGEIKNGQIYLNQLGKIVADEWLKTCKIRPNFKLDEWVIMPNHFHGIVIINDYSGDDQSLGARDAPLDLGARDAPLQQKPNSLSSCIAGFKSAVTKRINLLRQNTDPPIWQRNYYESILRDEKYLAVVREYIINNPKNWPNDRDYLPIDQQSQELYLDLLF